MTVVVLVLITALVCFYCSGSVLLWLFRFRVGGVFWLLWSGARSARRISKTSHSFPMSLVHMHVKRKMTYQFCPLNSRIHRPTDTGPPKVHVRGSGLLVVAPEKEAIFYRKNVELDYAVSARLCKIKRNRKIFVKTENSSELVGTVETSLPSSRPCSLSFIFLQRPT